MQVTANKRGFGIALATFAILFWGITFVSTKSLLNDFSAFEILIFRFVIAYISLWILRPRIIKIEAKDNLLFAMAGLSGVVLYQYAENIAISYTTASNVSIIVSICPMFTAIISQIFLKEKHLNKYFIIGFVIAISGVTMVSLNGLNHIEMNPKGDMLALIAAVCWGFYSLSVSIINRKGYDAICGTRRIFFFAVLSMIPLAIYGNHTEANQLSHFCTAIDINQIRFGKILNIINLCFLGIMASAICFCAWNKACNILGTVKVSISIYLIPVVTIIFAHFCLGENISTMGLIGAATTIIGLFVSSKKK